MVELYQIYLITDLSNNKKYVGQVIKHRGYMSRFNEHLRSVEHTNNRLLSNAIKKHGKESFTVELIEDDIPENIIDEREQYYIQFFDTFYMSDKGYNMTIGGQGVHQYKHTQADRDKISASSKKFWEELRNNPDKLQERNKKISKAHKHPKTEEHRKHLSEAAKKRFEKECGTFKGKHHTEATKKIISEKNGVPVAAYDKQTGELFKVFPSACAACTYLVSIGATTNKSAFTRIINICKGIDKSAYGYIWQYYEEGVSTIPTGSRVETLPLEALSPDKPGE